MTFALGTATGRIEIEYDGTGVQQAEQDVAGLNKKSGDAVQGINTLANTAGVAGLAIAGGLALGVNAAADFEARMSAISAVSGATGDDLDKVRQKAIQLGKDTTFSSSEAALAIEELAKAGLTVPDIMNGAADSAVALAAAGEIALPEAAAIASNAMNQFGLSAEDMVGVADLFAGAANTSAVGVSEIGQALQQVGAVANLAGVSLEDTTAAIALLGNAGIAGSDAGTSLKSMFMRLNPSTKKASDLFKELGIITEEGNNRFYDAQGNLKGLADVSQILQTSMKGMTAQQKQAALTTLFGSDAIRAAAILTKSGAKGFDQMADSMGKVSAADVAKTRLDNFNGSMEAMKGSLEAAGIAVGTILIPFLRQLVDAVTQAANWFGSLSDTQQKWIVGVLAAVSAILLLAAGIGKLIVFINAVRIAYVALRAAAIPAWLAALGPIGLIIAAIALVVAAVVLLWKKSETFRNIVTGVWNAIKAAAMAVADWFMGTLVPIFQSVWDGIKTGLTAIKNFFVAVWDAIVAVITTAVDVIMTIIMTYFNIYKTIITTALNVIKAIWDFIWGTFGGLITAVFELIVAIIKLYLTIIKVAITLALMAIKAVFSAVWNAIVAIFRAVWNVISTVVRTQVNIVRSIITAAWNVIRAVTSAIWNGIKAVISAVWGVIGGTVTSAVNRVKSVITAAWNAVKSATQQIWNGIKNAVSSAIDGLMQVVNTIQSRILGAFAGAATWLWDKGVEIIQGLIGGIESMVDKARDAVGKVTDAIGGLIPGSPVKEGALTVLNRGYAGKQIIQMVIDGILMNQRALENAAGDVMGMIPTTVPVAPGGGNIRPRGGGGAGGGRSRLIDGELRIVDGKAWVTGIAMDVDDEGDDYDDTLGRMN